jgi:hypothetical protein
MRPTLTKFDDLVVIRRYASSSFFAVANQLLNTVAQLRALANPELQTVVINAQTLFLTTGNGIEKTNTLKEAAITGAAAVGYSEMIKRTLFRAAA